MNYEQSSDFLQTLNCNGQLQSKFLETYRSSFRDVVCLFCMRCFVCVMRIRTFQFQKNFPGMISRSPIREVCNPSRTHSQRLRQITKCRTEENVDLVNDMVLSR